tara:strand:- start:654 stop:827 length:174 start_codon:yes stop_codon:yes gene_type:complete
MKLKIRGNDIELNDQKIGRLFDINTFQKQDLEDLFDKANNYEEDVEKAFQDGKTDNE